MSRKTNEIFKMWFLIMLVGAVFTMGYTLFIK